MVHRSHTSKARNHRVGFTSKAECGASKQPSTSPGPLEVVRTSPVLLVVGSCQRGLRLPMTSGTNPGRGFCAVLLSPAAASADPLCNVTFLRQMWR